MCWAPALPNAVCRSNTLKMMVSISVGRVEKVFESVGKCFLFQPIRAPHALSPRLALAPILCCAASGEREREGAVTSPELFTRGQAPPTDGDTHTHTHTHTSLLLRLHSFLQLIQLETLNVLKALLFKTTRKMLLPAWKRCVRNLTCTRICARRNKSSLHFLANHKAVLPVSHFEWH